MLYNIWYFKIISESAVAAGIRRIEAVTNEIVKDYFLAQDNEYDELKTLLKNPSNTKQAILKLQEENSSLKKEVEKLIQEKAKSLKNDLKNQIEALNGVNFLATSIEMDAGTIKNMAFELGEQVPNLFFINGSKSEGKAMLTVYISKNLSDEKKLNAGAIVRELGKYIEGGGGGQPFFATAGGKNPDGISKALTEARNYVI